MCGLALDLARSFFGGMSFLTFNVVGTNLVKSALRFRICGLASMIEAVGLDDGGLDGTLVLSCGRPLNIGGAPGRRPLKNIAVRI